MKYFIALALAALLLYVQPAAAAQAAPDHPEQIWQLLDYVAVDYRTAVADGQVISATEYAEMIDFTDSARTQLAALQATASRDRTIGAVDALRAAIRRRDAPVLVASLAREAGDLLAAAYPWARAPTTTPDVGRGRALYVAHCVKCHGDGGDGDGPLAAGLDPKPVAFTDVTRARERSLMGLYQAVSHGVGGTSMPAYSGLPESDRWILAFFTGGMGYDDAMRARGAAFWNDDGQEFRRRFTSLAELTTTTETELAATMTPTVARDLMAYLRAQPDAIDTGALSGLALARVRLQESLAASQRGDRAEAVRLALSAYLDGIEPIEPVLRARDTALLGALESDMLAYRSALASGTPALADADAGARRLEQLIARADAVTASGPADPFATFTGALAILLREGVEALLIVIGIVAFLNKADRRQALVYVHAGWISALLAGALTWAAATHAVAISGASREVVEGCGSLVAAAVLVGVGLWMHQKSAAGRWQQYLEDKVAVALDRRSAWGLFALAFVAVYREVFETALFYSALAVDGSSGALACGFIAAVSLLAVIAWVLLRTSARLPLAKFFSLTSVLVAILAVVLAGKGVAALQEAGWIGVSPIRMLRVDWAGLYSTAETVGAQGFVAAVALAGFAANWLVSGRRVGR